jgi:protease-4
MKRTLRTATCGLLLTLLGGLLLPQEALAAKKILRLRLDGPVMEAPNDAAGLMALFNAEKVASLREWVTSIRGAANDASVAGLVLVIEQPEVSLAQVEELTRAIHAFRDKGKPVYAYLDEAGNATYALAAAADHITLAENSALEIVGLHGEMMFFKGLLDKLGIEADMLHCGAYKSALEPFTRTEPSPEAAENVNWLLDSLFERWINLLAAGRKLTPDQVKKLVDEAPLSAQQALDGKLIDEIGSYGSFRKRLHKEFGKEVEVLKKYEKGRDQPELDTENPFAFFNVISELMKGPVEMAGAPGVGLVYVDGGITTGKSDKGGLGGSQAGSTTIRAALEKARADENIRAVVLRVNSPGGSALASDIIWNAAKRCADEKPLIVSMGGVAGSGGYYVSVPGDTVFAEASTITGSIGVVGGKLVWNGLLAGKLGITTTEFTRGKHAGLMSASRRWNDDERLWMTNYMNSVYEQFKGRVMTSRGDRIKKDLESIAGGRVYTGQQALELGLVDKLGGLTDALDLAASKAGLGTDYSVQVLPKSSGFLEFIELLEQLTGKNKEDEFDVTIGSPSADASWLQALLPLARDLAPQQITELCRGLRNLLILNHERVGCFMPFVPQVR